MYYLFVLNNIIDFGDFYYLCEVNFEGFYGGIILYLYVCMV